MSCLIDLAKQRAAMVACNIDFTNNGIALQALPASLTALNATYTRNSVKNVVQSGALVSLSANQFGTSYDPVAATYGYEPEPAATNLATYSDGTVSNLTTAAGVSNGTAVPGFANGIAFGDNSISRTAYKTVTLSSATAYSISFFVIMDDGNAPVVGTSISTGDFSFVMNGNLVPNAALSRLIGSNVYRVSASYTTVSTDGRIGCVKYTGQSARTFRITGIQVETGLRATSYIATTGSTASRAADVLSVPLWVNNILNSVFSGGGVAPTGWTRPFATGSSAPVSSSVFAGETAYLQSGTAQRPYINFDKSVQAGESYTMSMQVESVTGTVGAQYAITPNLGGVTLSWPVCEANPSGGINGTIVAGRLVVIAAIGTAGTLNCRFGLGAAGPATGTLQFSRPQLEPGTTATTYRPTTSTLESTANANIPGFSSAGYTLFADLRMDTATSGITGGVAVSVTRVANNANFLNRDSSIRISPYSIIDGSVVAYSNADTISASRKRAAGTFTASNVDGAINGSTLTLTADAPQLLTSPTELTIGCKQTTAQLNGFIFRAGLIPQALTQAQINGLTVV